MDNAEAVARLTDVDQSGADAKYSQADHSASKIPLDAQTILDGAYSELVQSGKVEAGTKITLHCAQMTFSVGSKKNPPAAVAHRSVTTNIYIHAHTSACTTLDFGHLPVFLCLLFHHRIKYCVYPLALQGHRNSSCIQLG